MFSVFSMFSMVLKLTSCSPIRDGRMEQLVEPCFLNTEDDCTHRCFFLCAKKVNIIERNMIRTKTWRIGQLWFEILCVLNITGLVCINGSIVCKAHLFAKAVDFFFSCRNVYSDGVKLACGKRVGLPCGPPVFTARPSVRPIWTSDKKTAQCHRGGISGARTTSSRRDNWQNWIGPGGQTEFSKEAQHRASRSLGLLTR